MSLQKLAEIYRTAAEHIDPADISGFHVDRKVRHYFNGNGYERGRVITSMHLGGKGTLSIVGASHLGVLASAKGAMQGCGANFDGVPITIQSRYFDMGNPPSAQELGFVLSESQKDAVRRFTRHPYTRRNKKIRFTGKHFR